MSNVSQQLLSGALSGLVSSLALQPLDFLKTRVQRGDDARSNTPLKPFQHFTGICRQVLRTQGPLGFWRGTAATLTRNVPGVAMYFAATTQLRTALSRSRYFALSHSVDGREASRSSSRLAPLTKQGNLLSGTLSRVFVGFLLNPISVVKARYESNLYSYDSLGSALRSVWRGGTHELYRGFVASSLRDAPYAGIFVVSYEGLKRQFSDVSSLPATTIHASSAAIASTFATLVTHPFDVLKTRIQVRPENKYQTIGRAARAIIEKRGASGFLDGLSLRLTRKVCSSVIAWAVFESLLIIYETG